VTTAENVDREEDAIVGRSIGGKYVVENVLGIGSMGAVYRARQPALDRTVAIKVMSARLAAQPDFVQRFHREAKAASRLWHPNSVTVTDFGEEPDGLLYLVMEYVPGRTLDRLVQDEFPLPMDRVVSIVVQVLSAVAAAHDLGVIHRDLKPENILVSSGLDDDGSIADIVKVCDFGIAALAGDPDAARGRRPDEPVLPLQSPESNPGSQRRPSQKLTVAGTIVGTPAYMSPEQAQGLPPEASSDLYSVGAVLYELLTRRPPFELDALDELLHAHLITTPADPRSLAPHVDPNVAAVCLRALAKEPHARHPNARAMRAALRRAIDPNAFPAPSSGDTIGFTSPPPPVVEKGPEPSEEPHPMTVRVTERPTEAPPPLHPSSAPPPHSPRRSTAPPPSAWGRHRWLAGPIGLVLAAALVGLFIRRTIERRAELESASQSRAAAATSVAPSTSDDGPSSSAESSGARFPAPGAAVTAAASPVSNTAAAAKTKPTRNEPPVPSSKAKGPTATAASPEPMNPPIATSSLAVPAASAPPTAPTTAATPTAKVEVLATPAPAAAYDASRARVTVTVTSVKNAARSSIVELVGHVSMTACYQTRLRALGKPEGGSGSMHLDIDEDGVVQSASVRLPPALAPASACFSAQLAKHRLTRPPDTGSATAELSLELSP